MKSKLFLFLLLATFPLVAAYERKIEELRIEVGDLSKQLKGQKIEIDLLTEQLRGFQTTLDAAQVDKKAALDGDLALEKEKNLSLEKRFTALEKSNKSLLTDFKMLKESLNSQVLCLSKCEEKLAALEGQLSSDVKSLKSTLEQVISLMQGEKSESKTYTVQSGDSLGKIAQEHHLSVKAIKEINNLSSDQIVIGQKLTLSK